MSVKNFGNLFVKAGWAWLDDKAPRLGAALAYYAIFSLAPLLVIAIALAGLIFGQEAAQKQIVGQIQQLVGQEGGQTLQTMIQSAYQHEAAGIVGTILGIVMLVVGAIGLIGQLQDALNTVWGVQPKPGRGIWGFIQDRFLSFSMVLGIAFLLLVSLLVSAAIAALMELLGTQQTQVLGMVFSEVISVLVFTLLFAMIFRFLPDAKIVWSDVWLGAALTAILFEVGKFLIGLYLGRAGIASAYGAAGSLAVLLVWLYYSGQIFLYGAEFTKVYANGYGSHIVPAENALPVRSETRLAS